MLSQALAFNADIVTIKLGTNDTKPQNWDSHKGEFKADYLSMIDTFQALPSNPDIFLVLPVPVFRDNYGIRASVLKEMIPIIKDIGAERNLPVIDANTPLLPFGQYFPDGIHPNTTGADSIAHVIYRVLMEQTTVRLQYEPVPAHIAAGHGWSVSVRFFGNATVPAGHNLFDPVGRVVRGGRNNTNTAVLPLIRLKTTPHTLP